MYAYVHMYICTHAYMHVYIHRYTNIHVCIRICMQYSTYWCSSEGLEEDLINVVGNLETAAVLIYTSIQIHTYMHIYTRRLTDIYEYVHKYTYIRITQYYIHYAKHTGVQLCIYVYVYTYVYVIYTHITQHIQVYIVRAGGGPQCRDRHVRRNVYVCL